MKNSRNFSHLSNKVGKSLFFIGSGTLLILCILLIPNCRKDPFPLDPSTNYPTEVGQILVGKCAISGCHNSLSKNDCSGLDFSSWEKLFEGGKNNSSVIPYRPDQSYLFFSVNTFSDLGPHGHPTMPLNHPHLTRDEVFLVRDWIASGAPAATGEVKFSDNPNRKKIYVANQGCDLVTVIDAETKLVMRCVDVGRSSIIESPHDIMVSPDGQFWYVTFYIGNYLQKYSCADDRLVAELDLGTSSWHSMAISPDSRYALVSHWEATGRVGYIDLDNMTILKMYLGLYSYPHGCAFSADSRYSYIVSQMGNFIYKTDLSDLVNVDYEMIPLQTGDIPQFSGPHKPYVVKFSPDHSKYYVICQGTDEVRVFNAANDSLIHTIPSTGVPQLIEFSQTTPYAFVTCMSDTNNNNTISSVDILNYNSNTYFRTVFPGFEERGLAVDDANGVVYVGNRNVNPGGPAPHHTTACVGRNGDITLISLSTLQVITGWKAELSVDPYSLTIRP